MKKTIALAAVLLGSAAVSSLFAQGQVLWGNQFTGALQARVYAPEPSDSTRRLTGNAANGQPIGTTVYSGAVLQGTGFTGFKKTVAASLVFHLKTEEHATNHHN